MLQTHEDSQLPMTSYTEMSSHNALEAPSQHDMSCSRPKTLARVQGLQQSPFESKALTASIQPCERRSCDMLYPGDLAVQWHRTTTLAETASHQHEDWARGRLYGGTARHAASKTTRAIGWMGCEIRYVSWHDVCACFLWLTCTGAVTPHPPSPRPPPGAPTFIWPGQVRCRAEN